MDTLATIQELEGEVQSFCEARDWDQFHGPKDLAIGLVTESSELLELFRFKSEAESRALFKDTKKLAEIRHEVADVLFFLLRFAQMYDIDLSDALREKIARNAERYPIDKAKGRNAKYDELQG